MTYTDTYNTIEKAMAIIADMQHEQPELSWISAELGLSESYLQRTFKQWVGLSPKKFLQHLTLNYAKTRLEEGASILDTSMDAGLSAPSRMHDLFVIHEGFSPGEYKNRGYGITITWGWAKSPFGAALVMQNKSRLVGLAFASAGKTGTKEHSNVLANMKARWPAAVFIEDIEAANSMGKSIFGPKNQKIDLQLLGTPFQIKVWQALLEIPSGGLVGYGDIAKSIAAPRAARAVGAAIGRNPISWLIPCHRVILSNGYLRNYEWGIPRKLAMIGWEAAKQSRRQP